MRVYALLLGVLFTTGYGYAAHVAVSSRPSGAVAATRPAAGRIWYGGTLDPITVRAEARAVTPAASHSRLLDRPAVRCPQAVS
jgi:hypothetical protein